MYFVSRSMNVHALWFYNPFIFSALLFSLLPSRNSGVTQQTLLPPPRYGSCLAFLSREDFIFLSPLADSRRIALQRDGACSKQHFVHLKFYIPDSFGNVCHLDYYTYRTQCEHGDCHTIQRNAIHIVNKTSWTLNVGKYQKNVFPGEDITCFKVIGLFGTNVTAGYTWIEQVLTLPHEKVPASRLLGLCY